MTIDKAIVWAEGEVSRAEENARNCYSLSDIPVEALQRAADKVKQCRQIKDMMLKLLAIEKILEEKDSYTDQEAQEHLDRIKKVIDAIGE